MVSRFSVLISYICGYLIIFPYPAVSHDFQGPDFLGYRFFMVQVRAQGPDPDSRVQGPGPRSESGARARGRGQVLEVAIISHNQVRDHENIKFAIKFFAKTCAKLINIYLKNYKKNLFTV